MGVQAIRCTAISIYFGFRGVRGGVYDAVSRAGSLETCGFKQHFWSLLGLRPKVTCARGRGIFPLLGTWRKHERAVGDAGPYGVRPSGCAGIRETADMGATVPLHDNRPARRRAVRGSGSGSYRRVPEPVIARHPRGAWERQRGWERKRFPMGLFASYHVRRKGIPKTMGLWRRSFPYFFRC